MAYSFDDALSFSEGTGSTQKKAGFSFDDALAMWAEKPKRIGVFASTRLKAQKATGNTYDDGALDTTRAVAESVLPFTSKLRNIESNEQLASLDKLSKYTIPEPSSDGRGFKVDPAKTFSATRADSKSQAEVELDSIAARAGFTEEDFKYAQEQSGGDVRKKAEIFRSLADSALKWRIENKASADKELASSEQGTLSKIGSGIIDNAGYTAEFAIGGGIGGAAKLAVPVIASAANRMSDLSSKDYSLDKNGEVVAKDNADSQGAAMGKASVGAAIEAGVEIGTDEALKWAFGPLGKALSKPVNQATRGVVKSLSKSVPGRVVLGTAKAYQKAAEVTAVNGLGSEMIENYLQDTADEIGGLGKKTSEYKGLGQESEDYGKKFFSTKYHKDMFLSMLGTMALQGGAASAKQYVVESGMNADKEGFLKAHGLDDADLKQLSATDKTYLFKLFYNPNMTPEYAQRALRTFGYKVGAAAKKITDQKGYDFYAKQEGIEPNFKLPPVAPKDNEIATDEVSGLGVVKYSDGGAAIFDRDGKEAGQFGTLKEAIDAAKQLSVRNQAMDARREQKVMYIAGVAKRLAGKSNIRIHNTVEDMIDDTPDIANDQNYSPESTGVNHKGVTHIVLDNIQSPNDAVSIILHEVGAHQGLRNVLSKPEDLKKFLGNMGSDDVEENKEKAKANGYSGEDVVPEEALAWMYEKRLVNPTGYQKAVSWLHTQLRKVNPDYNFTDSDIAVMMADAQKSVQGEGGSFERGTPKDTTSDREQAAYDVQRSEQELSYAPVDKTVDTQQPKADVVEPVKPPVDLAKVDEDNRNADPQMWTEAMRAARNDVELADRIFSKWKIEDESDDQKPAQEPPQSTPVEPVASEPVVAEKPAEPKPSAGDKMRRESFRSFFDAANQSGEYDLLQRWYEGNGLFGKPSKTAGGEYDAYRALPPNLKKMIRGKSKLEITSASKELAEEFGPEYADPVIGPELLVNEFVRQYGAYQGWKENGAVPDVQADEYAQRAKAEHEQEKNDLAVLKQKVDNGEVIADGTPVYVSVDKQTAKEAGIDPDFHAMRVQSSYVKNGALVYRLMSANGKTVDLYANNVDKQDISNEVEYDESERDYLDREDASPGLESGQVQADSGKDYDADERAAIEWASSLDEERIKAERSGQEGLKNNGSLFDEKALPFNLDGGTQEDVVRIAEEKKAEENRQAEAKRKLDAAPVLPGIDSQVVKESLTTGVSKPISENQIDSQTFKRGTKVATTRNADGISYFGEVLQSNPDGTVKIRAFKEKRKGTIAAKNYGVDSKGNQVTKDVDVPAESVKSVDATADTSKMTDEERRKLKMAEKIDAANADNELRKGNVEAPKDLVDSFNSAKERKEQRKTDNGSRFMKPMTGAPAGVNAPRIKPKITPSGTQRRYVRAYPSVEDESRRREMAVELAYENGLTPRTIAEMEEKGRAKYDSDAQMTEMDLLTGRLNSDKPEDMAAARVATDELNLKANKSTDPNVEATAILGTWRWYEKGTQVARSLRMRFDKVDTPESRLAWLSRALRTPTAKERDMLAKTEGVEAQVAALKPAAERARKILKALRDTKVRLDKEGKEIDLDFTNFTNEQLMDNRLMNQVLVAIATQSSSLGDKIHEYWRNSILSGPTTQFVNIGGNLANAVLEATIQRNVEAFLNLWVQSPLAPTFHSNKVMYSNVRGSFGKAKKNFIEAWVSERPVTGPGGSKLEEANAAIPGMAGKIIRIPQRAMVSVDEAFKTVFMSMLTADHATREFDALLKSGKVKESDRSAYMTASLDPNSKAYAKAWDETLRWSFQSKSGIFVRSLSFIRNHDSPVGFIAKFVLPFINTPANVMKTGIRKSPFGIFPLFYEAGTGRYKGSPEANALMVRRVSEQLIAYAILYTLIDLVKPDDDDEFKRPLITGSRKTFVSQGQRESETRNYPPTSIRIGNKWFNYGRLEPFATMMATTVDILNAWGQHKKGFDSDATGTLVNSLSANFRDKAFLTTIGDIIDAFQEGGAQKGAMIAQRVISGFSPNLVRSIMRSFDPYIRDMRNSEKGVDWLKTAGVRTLQMAAPLPQLQPEPRKDIYGRDVEKAGGVLYNALSPFRMQDGEKITKVDAMLKKWNDARPVSDGWYPAPPDNPKIKILGTKNEIKLTPEEFSEYQRMAGEFATKRLTSMRFNYDNPSDKDIKRVRDVFTDAREMARNRIRPKVISRAMKERKKNG